MIFQVFIDIQRIQRLGVKASQEHIDHNQNIDLLFLDPIGNVAVIGIELVARIVVGLKLLVVFGDIMVQLVAAKQERFDQLKHHIQMLMKNAERATFAHGSVVWKKAKDSISLNTKALLQHQPELIELYPLQKQGSRRFNIYTD